MENKIINLATVAKIARLLKDFNERLVYVGGAIISLYTDDSAADEIRPTYDIDLTLEVTTYSHWQKIQSQLASLGIHPNPEGKSIYSYQYQGIPLDFISAEDDAFGPSNKWYKEGFKDLQKVQVEEELISIFKAPCFLATKIEAFKNRGSDPRTSHDIEDVVYVLDNRKNIVEEILTAPGNIKYFVISEIKKFKENGILEEVLLAHIHPLMQAERLEICMEKLDQIIDGI
jgi:hypothetical protein